MQWCQALGLTGTETHALPLHWSLTRETEARRVTRVVVECLPGIWEAPDVIPSRNWTWQDIHFVPALGRRGRRILGYMESLSRPGIDEDMGEGGIQNLSRGGNLSDSCHSWGLSRVHQLPAAV